MLGIFPAKRLSLKQKRGYDFHMHPLFDLSHTIASPLLEDDLPFNALIHLRAYIESLFPTLRDYDEVEKGIYIHRNAIVSDNAVLLPPTVIMDGAELRTGAFIRGSVIIGRNATVGNSVEVKNSILFDEVEVPHLSYIGDSILGYRAHFGAGAMTSNVRLDKKSVRIKLSDRVIDTGLSKLGALVGDRAEIGSNSVLNPGTVIGRDAIVYPLTVVYSSIEAGHIMKSDGTVVRRGF